MFLSWWRGLVESGLTRKERLRSRRRALPRRFRAAISLEQLEDRVVPVAGKASVYLNVGATITQVNSVTAARSTIVPVFVDFHTNDITSANGGLGAASYYVVYDPTVLSISQTGSGTGSDIKLGSLVSTPSLGYSLVNATTGSSGYEVGVAAISINHAGSNFVTGSITGHLLEIDFHVLPTIAPGVTTLLDLEAKYNDGVNVRQTFQNDKGNTAYTLFESGSTTVQLPAAPYAGSLTQSGALTPSTFTNPQDSDTSDAAIQIVTLTPNQAPTGVADSFSIAPNDGNFPPGTMSIPGSAAVLANDTRTSNGPMYAAMVGTGVTTVSPAIVATTDLVETGSTVTVTTATSHSYIVGESINISRSQQFAYDGFFTITSVISDTQFTYTDSTLGIPEDATGVAQVLANTTLFTQNTPHGVMTFNATDGSLSYTPTPNFVGVDSFTYQAVDAVSNTPSPTVTATIYVGGLISIPQNLIPSGGTVTVPVLIASGNPANSGGVANIKVGINYDASVLSLADVSNVVEGALPTAAGWGQFTVVNGNNDPNAGPGQIVITTSDTGGAAPLTTTAGGTIALITFDVVGMPTGSTTLINVSGINPGASEIDVAGAGTPLTLPFAIAPLDNTNFNDPATRVTDGIVTFSSGPIATTTNLTVTAGGFSFSTLTYGSPITLKATVSPNAGTNAPSVGQVVFKDGSTTLGTLTTGSLVNGTEVYTLITPAKQFNVSNTTHVISAFYTDTNDSNYSASNGTQTGSFVVAPKNLTVTTLTATKAYDTNASASPTPTVTGLITGDTATGFSESFDNKNAGTGKTMTLNGGYTITDGNSGNNYTVVPALNTTGKITARSITVTAGSDAKGYDGTTGAATVPTITGGSLLSGDAPAFIELYDTRNVGTNKTLTVSGSVNDGNSGGNYAVTPVTNATGKITARAITVSAVTSTKVYDGTITGGVTPSISGGSLATGDTNAFTESFDNKNVGTGKTLSLGGSANDGNGGNNYLVSQGAPDTSGAITVRAVTVTAATNTKGYDSTTTAAATPTFTSGSLAAGDTASFTETYDTRHVGTGKTLTPAGAITDGNNGSNYALTLATSTTGAISARALTVTAVTSTRVYDGTTAGGVTPNVTGGSLISGDTAAFVESFDTKHVGTSKTLTASGSVSDGNSGGDYAVSFVPDTSGKITQRAITVTATTYTKAFDTNVSAAAIPTVSSGTIASGDTPHFTETYSDPSVATGKTLIPAGTVTDGNSGTDYAVVFQNDTTGAITSTGATATTTTVSASVGGSAVTTVTYGTRVTLTATVAGSGTAPSIGQVDFMDGTTDLGFNTASLQTSSTAVFTLVTSARQLQVIAANGGVHTITASYHDNVDSNYLDSNATLSGGLGVTARALTVTAATNTKGYDGTNSALATPSVTSGTLVAGDTAAFTETYDTRHAGTGKTLAPGGSVNDGNGGNDYSVVFANVTSGKITARAITVTAATSTKGYDSTTTSSATPTVTGGSVATGDSAAFTESFDTRNAGSNKALTPGGSVSDGNSGNDYAVSLVTDTSGKITARAITVTAATNTKGYDGTTTVSVTPTLTGGSIAAGDTAAFTEAFDTKNVGTGKTLTPAGSVSDGNSGLNYSVSVVADNTGKITTRAITVLAGTNTKGYDGTTSAATLPTFAGGGLATGDSAAFAEVYDSKHVATGKTLTVTGSVNDGNGGANYAVTPVSNTSGKITTRAITVSAVTSTKSYDGTTTSSATPGITGGSLPTGDVNAFVETFDNKNVGTAKTLTLGGSVNDGNGGADYSVTLGVPDTTGKITIRAITVTAATSTKGYDSTTTSSATPTVTGGTLASGDSLVFTESFDTRLAGSGKTLTPAGSVSDGNSGNNYTVALAADTSGKISPRLLTITAATDTKAYDGTTASSATPTITGGSLVSGDTAAFTESFTNKNAGTNKTLTAAGAVSDGNSGGNYSVSFVNATSGKITARALTVTAATDTKGYDGGVTSTATPAITGGAIASGDTPAFAEAYDTKNAGTGKTLTPGGSVNDGNGGSNYTVSTVSDTSGKISARAITVTAATSTKSYDSTTASSGTPTLTGGSLAGGDALAYTESFDTRNAGTGKTLTASGSVSDGNGGANYTVSTMSDTSGKIAALAITVTAATSTKTYDSTTASSATPTVTGGGLVGGDVLVYTESFDTRNAGTGKTLTPAGSVNDGNGGADYTVSPINDTSGKITARAITVTASSSTKTYDSTTVSSATPTLTGGSVIGGDILAYTESFDTRNAGSGKTLTVSGSVNDGNGGANYAVSPVTDTSGKIAARALTVTAATSTKIYDSTAVSAAIPTLTGGSLVSGDLLAFTESFDTRNAGTGKTLTPSGSVNDGNSGGNYTVTPLNDTSGKIITRTITVTAASSTKVYDGTATSSATPTLTGGSLAGGDSLAYSESFDTKNAGSNKVLTAAGSVSDGNGGNNYAVTTNTDTTGKIFVRSITVTAATNTKVYDGGVSSAANPTVTSGSLASGDSASFTETYDTKNVGTGKTLTAAGSVSDGNGGNNYSVAFNNITTGSITVRALTVTAATSTKAYDATTSSSALPTVTSGTLAAGDSITGLGETYDTSSLGTGKTLTVNPGYTVNDGNSGHNYAVSLAANTTGAIVPGPFAKYVINILGGTNVTAGNAFIINVQATDSFGNPVSGYSGPSDVIVTASPGDPLGNFPFSGTLLSIGTGYFLGSFKTVGSYTITASAGSFTGTSDPITVRAGTAVYFTATAPSNTLTGNSINTTVTAYDLFNNVATGYTGHVHFTSTDAGALLPPDSTLTNGTGIFPVTLKTPGTQTITAGDFVSAAPRPITGTTGPIITRGLQVTGFTARPDGFTVTFNKQFVPADLALYGPTLARLPDVALVAPNPVGGIHGSLVIDPSNQSLTFKATQSYLSQIINDDGSVIIPDATYTLTLVAGAGLQGFQDALGGGLDGLANGTVHNFTTTFTTHYHADHTPVLAIPDFARGPDSSSKLVVPNDISWGLPITLFNAHNVTDVTFTLSYNPALLNVLGSFTGNSSDTTDPNASLTLLGDSGGLATFSYHDAAPLSGNVVLGDLLAKVPDSAKNLYQVKELLNLNVLASNGGAGTVTDSGLHVNAYLADVNGDHAINGLDKLLIDTVSQGRATGFSQYAQLDPVIIGDVATHGQVDSASVAGTDTFASANPPGSGQFQIPVPPGLSPITSPNAADPVLSLVAATVNPSDFRSLGSRVTVTLDDPHPQGSTGLTEAVLALKYDPRVLSVSSSDIELGSLVSAPSGWHINSVIDRATGQIGIQLYGDTPITSAQAGSLVTIGFHLVPGTGAPATAVQLVNIATPSGQFFETLLADSQSALILGSGIDRVIFPTGIQTSNLVSPGQRYAEAPVEHSASAPQPEAPLHTMAQLEESDRELLEATHEPERMVALGIPYLGAALQIVSATQAGGQLVEINALAGQDNRTVLQNRPLLDLADRLVVAVQRGVRASADGIESNFLNLLWDNAQLQTDWVSKADAWALRLNATFGVAAQDVTNAAVNTVFAENVGEVDDFGDLGEM